MDESISKRPLFLAFLVCSTSNYVSILSYSLVIAVAFVDFMKYVRIRLWSLVIAIYLIFHMYYVRIWFMRWCSFWSYFECDFQQAPWDNNNQKFLSHYDISEFLISRPSSVFVKWSKSMLPVGHYSTVISFFINTILNKEIYNIYMPWVSCVFMSTF